MLHFNINHFSGQSDIMDTMHRKDLPWPGECRVEGFDLPGFEFDVTDTVQHPTLAVRWAGRELLGDDRVAETMNYPYAIVGFGVQGSHIIEADKRKITVEAGMAFWIKDFHDAVRASVPQTYPISLLVMLVGDELDKWWSENLRTPVGNVQLSNPHLIESVMMDIMEEGRYDTIYKEENCVALAKVLLRRVGNELNMSNEDSQTAKATYRRCRHYINAHFSTIRSLAQVAEACGISIPYLCRLFENYADTSPYELLTQLRLRKAAMMLSTTRLPVATVAQQVGYRNIPQFSRMFKVAFGVPPSQYAHTAAVKPD